MNLSPELILPSQNFLKPDTIKFILECYAKNDSKSLPPMPIVRRDEDGNYIAIDGHNLIAVKMLRGESIDVHVAKDPDDGLPVVSEANVLRNQDLRDKFATVLNDRENVKNAGIHTFRDLVAKYPELFSM